MSPHRVIVRLALCGMLLVSACKRTAPPLPPDAATAREGDHEVKPVYPALVGTPSPLAVKLCGTMHGLAEAQRARCCGRPPSAGLELECVRTLSVALADRAVAIDGAALDRCTAALERSIEGCDWVVPIPPEPPAECRALLAGQLSSGARCRSSLEGKQGLGCAGVGPTQPGVCAEPAPVGQSCGGSVDTLAAYTRQTDESAHPSCVGFCARGRCNALVGKGEACKADAQCGTSARCDRALCVAGPAPGLGEACSGSCAPGGFCARGKCVALKRAGAPCTSPFECRAACNKPAGAQLGVCGMKCSAWPPAGYPYPGQSPKQ